MFAQRALLSRMARIELATGPRHAPGDVIAGRLAGALGAPVVLARLEHRPEARRAVVVARTCASEADGSFAIEVPDSALPSVAGRRCAIAYAVRSLDNAMRGSDGVEIVAMGPAHLDAGSGRIDRVLPDREARHFRIELAEAAIHGGGVLTGRVHHGRPWLGGPITVEVRCSEWWRTRLAFHGVPQWETAMLWRRDRRLDVDPDATWSGFSFGLPPWLPPAVEAHSIAWRYEVRATRARWLLDETATLTPLVFEDVPRIEAL